MEQISRKSFLASVLGIAALPFAGNWQKQSPGSHVTSTLTVHMRGALRTPKEAREERVCAAYHVQPVFAVRIKDGKLERLPEGQYSSERPMRLTFTKAQALIIARCLWNEGFEPFLGEIQQKGQYIVGSRAEGSKHCAPLIFCDGYLVGEPHGKPISGGPGLKEPYAVITERI